MRRKLIIDADPGIGDALAIALAIADPALDVIGLTAVPGCVSGEWALRNLQTICTLIDPPKWPRIGGTEGPPCAFPREEGLIDPVFLNGETGLGDVNVPNVGLHHRVDAVRLLVDLVRDSPGEVNLLALGPLTNIVLAMERFPDFLSHLGSLICLCGAIGVNGDVTPAAEFNAYANPEALDMILDASSTMSLIPLPTSRQAVLSFEQYNRLQINGMTRLGRLVEDIVPFGLRSHREHLGQEGWPMAEVTALASLVEPQLFEWEYVPLFVELEGRFTRGMTLVDRRPRSPRAPNVKLLTDVDTQGVLDYLARRLLPARKPS